MELEHLASVPDTVVRKLRSVSLKLELQQYSSTAVLMYTMPVLPSDASVVGDISPADLRVWSDHGEDSRLGEWSSLIGIVTAIVGNILIALALNVQRYSHIQLNRRRRLARARAKEALRRAQDGHRAIYDAPDIHPGHSASDDEADDEDNDYDPAGETHPLAGSFQSSASNWTEASGDQPPKVVSSSYLRSPSWWLGQVLMTVGEMGNFLAYGFAPASIVSPLGVVALISNCVIAPIFFGETFRKRDFWGVVVAVCGAITVVLSAKGEETKLDPHDVWDAITTMEFEIYFGITVALIVVLMWASPRYGNRTILIDLGLVGLFGGYTALTTKGVSSMLSSTLLKAFATPVTYGLIIVLLGTAVMQVRYVNKALQRFDSTQVIPIQFVLFTLSVIIGSAVLYRDFERTTAEQAAKFVGGCLLTFFGVFLITSGRHRQDDGDQLSDDEDIEETIGLRDQESADHHFGGVQPATRAPARGTSASGSRRPSRTSQISVPGSGTSLRGQQLQIRTSNRKTERSTSRSLSSPTETSPLLLHHNPWQDAHEDQEVTNPRITHSISADTVPTTHSVFFATASEPMPSSASAAIPRISPPQSPSPIRPATPPRPSGLTSRSNSHQRYPSTFISPSPLSSTVSAVVTDTLLRSDVSPTKRRKSIKGGARPTIRSSLFVPWDGSDDTGITSNNQPPPPVSDNERALASSEEDAPPSNGRERARSLSNTIGQLFARKRRARGNSSPEIRGYQSTSGDRADSD
ncbi:DUF803-domain-containing protein [Xylariaceae sp. FL0594]|nr:DUF803-domain-containing protein [Xylariaceae sp. FL0594]